MRKIDLHKRREKKKLSINYLLYCLENIHGRVFGSQMMATENSGEFALITEQDCYGVVINPNKDLFPKFIKFSDTSMYFVAILDKTLPTVQDRKLKGYYVINTNGVMNWLGKINSFFKLKGINIKDVPTSLIEKMNIINIIQLVAHEIRHNVQYFPETNIVLRKISEIEKISLGAFNHWHGVVLKRTIADGLSVDKEEDALTIEILVQNMLYKSSQPFQSKFDEIASLVKK